MYSRLSIVGIKVDLLDNVKDRISNTQKSLNTTILTYVLDGLSQESPSQHKLSMQEEAKIQVPTLP